MYEWSLNKANNVIYVEAPVGVGFSFASDKTAYENITDEQSSTGNFLFLEAFFDVFTDFKPNPFYITAESYGGHYGPTLAEQLIDHNNSINMKGFWIGNPGINSDWYGNVNEYAYATFLHSHGLIPALQYEKARRACGWDDFFFNCSEDFTHPGEECKEMTKKALSYIPTPLDPYDVLAPTCQNDASAAFVEQYTPGLTALAANYGLDVSYNPCIADWTPQYMNRDDVLTAIHAKDHKTRKWPDHPINWYYNEGPEGAKKDIALLFPKFFEKAPHWKIIVASGTADSAVPFLGTERWMECLDRDVKTDWRAWKMHGDVAGMIKDWEGMTFVTAKGCGHMIPLYCPEVGYTILQNWINGTW